MKVQIKVTVEVDEEKWAGEYGCDKTEVRQDVLAYFTHQIAAAPAIEDVELIVRVA